MQDSNFSLFPAARYLPHHIWHFEFQEVFLKISKDQKQNLCFIAAGLLESVKLFQYTQAEDLACKSQWCPPVQ